MQQIYMFIVQGVEATAEDVQGMFVCLRTEVVVKEEEEMVVAADEEMEEEEMEEEVVCERWDHTASHFSTRPHT